MPSGGGGAANGGQPAGGTSAGAAGTPASGSSGAPAGGTSGAGAVAGNAGSAQAGSAPQWGIDARPTTQTCVAPAERAAAAPRLSQTGCVDPADPKKPAASLVPYTVSSPLWSDKAEKLRYFALPPGTTIRVKDCQREPSDCESGALLYRADEGDWDFPNGTVLVKTFALGDRLVETRLLVRADAENWWGYSYEWRADQSDADLLAANTDGYTREIQTGAGVQTWHFPSR
ncbi:MAG TPA: hypothetical protein VIM73_01000, partial [Polyangiaceae bacterium]